MIKKEYMNPEVKAIGILEESELLAYSVKSSGLGDDELTQDDTSGNSWDDAMGRHQGVWDEGEDW